MSLSAAMWTGVSGLLTHGERMSVLGNNIANVNTVGFKASRMYFEDFISQEIGATGGSYAQVGRGVSVAAVWGDFSQGSFETTNEATDMAIGGRGFFGVKPQDQEGLLYTRAGNFRFDKDGYLVDPHRYVLQGWKIEESVSQASTDTTSTAASSQSVRRVGAPTDIRLEGYTAPPRHTNNIQMVSNLDSVNTVDNTFPTTAPFDNYFSLARAWNGAEVSNGVSPLATNAYAYSSTIKVYDEGGAPHNVTIYYDKAQSNGMIPIQKNVWEYIVTMDPLEDKRFFGFPKTAANSLEGTSGAGLLMMGTLTFNSAGQIENMSAFTLRSNAAVTAGGDGWKTLTNWAPTAISQNGYPLFAANFTGQFNASYVISSAVNPTSPSGYYVTTPNAQGKLIEMNFGLRTSPDSTWNTWMTPDQMYSTYNNDWTELPGFLPDSTTRSTSATTSYAGASSTLFQLQDGYTYGFLQNVAVDKDGVLLGRYSNGVSLQLFQVTLYDFNSKVNLRREGGNLFSETRDGPLSTYGPANTNGLGSISSNSLEQSNVDLAKEFVDMIGTQRGFSANGKVITTTDQMLAEIIMLKR